MACQAVAFAVGWNARLRAARFDAAAFAYHFVVGEGWWEVLVMLQSSLPTVIFDAGFTDRQPEHLPNWPAAP